MASTLTLEYARPVLDIVPAIDHHHYSTAAATRSAQRPHLDTILPHSASPTRGPAVRAGRDKTFMPKTQQLRSDPASFGALSAAREAAASSTAGRKDSRTSSRPSFGRGSLERPASSTPSSNPRPTGTKDRFKSNLKRIAQHKEDDVPSLDLSKTTEENERISGIDIHLQPRATRSVADRSVADMDSRRWNDPLAGLKSLKPSLPCFSVGSDSLLHDTTERPSTASVAGSDVSVFDAYASYRPSMNESRLYLPIATMERESSATLPHRPRRSTNPSMTSVSASSVVTPSSAKSRRSIDKAFAVLTRGSSANTSDEMADGTTRAASIQAARQAFDERQQAKDAKFEKRAAKEQDRREQKARRSSTPGKPAQSGKSQRASRARVEGEKGSPPVETLEYSRLPVPPLASRPGTNAAMKHKAVKMSGTRRARSRYAAILSWIKTRILNLKRRLT